MGYQRVIPADPVGVITGYLRDALAPYAAAYPSVYVGADKPTAPRAWIVTVRPDGGPHVDMATQVCRVGINVWGPTEWDLLKPDGLAQTVRSHLLVATTGTPPIEGVREVSGPVPIPDESEQAHVYLTFEVTLSGTPV
jgi:hypothetical protein